MDIPRLPEGRALRDQVRQVLEELIIRRDLAPGTRLREAELADKLGVSRNPVREALASLERSDWIESTHRQGARVRVPSAREAEQTLTTRSVLEVFAAREAARRISDDQLDELDELAVVAEDALAREDAGDLMDCNRRFHRLVREAADNDVLSRLLTQLEKRVMWLFAGIAVTRSEGSWREHERLCEALRRRDAEQAAEVMAEHTEATLRAYLGSGEAVGASVRVEEEAAG